MCYENYLEVDGKCIVDCRRIEKSAGNVPSGQECLCEPGYFFTEISLGKAACKLDCSKFPNTQALSPAIDSCLCV